VRSWRIAYLVLCVVGFLLSADLQRLHVNVHTDPDYQSYCAVSERVNCETVAASRYSVVLGLPLSIWGLLFYATAGALAVWSLRRRLPAATWPFGMLIGLAAVAAVAGVLLFWIAHFVIESICLMCVGTYLVNLSLFAVAWVELRRLRTAPAAAVVADLRLAAARPRPLLALMVLPLAAWVALALGLPRYWRIEAGSGPGALAVGRTAAGHHWIGARDGGVVVEEYSDYQCPHCQSGHRAMRELVANYPATLRLVHRNFPLDQACNPAVLRLFHPYACGYALLAWCAGEQGRFWEANDYLFSEGLRRERVTARELGDALQLDAAALSDCSRSDPARRAVQEDMAAARSHGVQGTPTFVVEGEVHLGMIPEELLSELLGGAPDASQRDR
jgi:protein-disulfide isomerase/uncharacterized membrane protein